MAHSFDRRQVDPYAEAAHQIEGNMHRGEFASGADAESQVFDALANAVVSALGDVAATAFRLGIDDRAALAGLGAAIARCAPAILQAYQGEVRPEPALEAVLQAPRLDGLPAEQEDRIRREVEKTRQLEELLLDARRLPDLLELAGSVGLTVPDDLMESGDPVMGARRGARPQ